MKVCRRNLGSLVVALALSVTSASGWAQWELDSANSAVNFISIKNDAVAEIHSFGDLVGYVGLDGQVQLSIALGSVETLIDIRNERMREMLFDTVTFPSAKVTAQVAPELIAVLAEGGTLSTDLSLNLSLHGAEKTLSVPVVMVGEGENLIRVFTARPLIVNAADFGLEPGIEALRKVAGLNTISAAVPVTVHLVFKRAPSEE